MAATAGTVRVRVAADLRCLLPVRHRRGELLLPLDGTSSVLHLVESLGVPRTEVGGLLADGAEVGPGRRPVDGWTVDVLPVRRPQPLPEPRFLLDVHLGTLARRMRLLGLDTAYRNDAGDPELVERSLAERRVLLTRDRGLLRRSALRAGGYVRGQHGDDQLADVLDRFAPPLSPWSRCRACNGLLAAVPRDAVAHLLRPGTLRSHTDFSRCDGCGRVYWRGAHAGRLEATVARATAGRAGRVVPEGTDE